jgi:hypothetical protein
MILFKKNNFDYIYFKFEIIGPMSYNKNFEFLKNNIGLLFSYSEIFYISSNEDRNDFSEVLEEIEE